MQTNITCNIADLKKQIDTFLKDAAVPNGNPQLALPLYRHQEIALYFARHLKYFADYSEPGTGKTAVQIALIKLRKVKTLIVCPKSIMEAAWQRDFAKFLPEIKPVLLRGGSAKIIALLHETYNNPQAVCIINYESTWRSGVKESLLQFGFQFIIVDESTRIKDRTTKQAKAIYEIGAKANYRSIMTGTPTPNSLLDIFGQMKFLDPNIFGYSYYRFREYYFQPIDFHQYEWAPRKQYMDELRSKIFLRGIRFEKKDCLDLPPLIVEHIKIDLPQATRKIYDEMAENLLAEIQGKKIIAANILTKLLRLNMITSGFLQNTNDLPIDLPAQPKIEALEELLSDINSNHKVIIWAVFIHDIRRILERLNKKHAGQAIALFGKTKQRELVINLFKNSSTVKYLIAHPATAGHGLTLTEASYAIYYSLNYSFEQYYQSIDRINRIGQIAKMTIYHILCSDTIDEAIYRALQQKKKIGEFVAALKTELKKN